VILKLPIEGKVAEESGIEDHTFGPTYAKEHFPEDELTLGKNKLSEVESLMEWEWIELNGIK